MFTKISKLSVAASLLVVLAWADEANVTRPNWSGEIRGGYQYTDESAHTAGESGLSTSIKYESNSWNNLVFGTRIAGVVGKGKDLKKIDFFDADSDGYGIVDELYMKGTFGNSELTIGRQAIDLPFVDTDSGHGLVDNRFEAIVFTNKDIKDTIITLAHVRSWSGVDSGDPSKFNRINGNDGIQLAGIEYAGIENLDLKAFGYRANDYVDALYLEAAYGNEIDLFKYSTTLQYALQDYDTGPKANVIGAALDIELKNIPLGLNIAYNRNFDDGEVNNLYGGGPFLTSMEHNTAKELKGKGNMLKVGISYDAKNILDGLVFKANYAKLTRSANPDAAGENYKITYKYSDSLGFETIYSICNDDLNGDMKNLLAFITYKF